MNLHGGRTHYGQAIGILTLDTHFPRIPGDSELFCSSLLKKGVSVVPGIFFGDYPHHFRLSLVSDRLKEAVTKMKGVAEEMDIL